jgi:hypothetical protein
MTLYTEIYFLLLIRLLMSTSIVHWYAAYQYVIISEVTVVCNSS